MQEIDGGLPSQALHWVLRNISELTTPSSDFVGRVETRPTGLFHEGRFIAGIHLRDVHALGRTG